MTTDNRKIQLEVGVENNTKPGLDSVVQGVNQMTTSVTAAADKAGQAVGGIGDKGQGSADKLDRSTKSIINSVQRATAALEAGGNTSAKYFESIANQRGANNDALKPYLDQLKAAERAQQVASGSLDKMGMSAKATTAALRQVPAQFTDIITSLQGGQAPLTVLLQQGGQLKDVFGGVGAAASALGKYVLGLVNPFTVAAAAVGALAYAYNLGSKEADEYRKALILTGNASGATAGQLQQYAQQISGVVGTQGKAAEAVTAFAASGKVGTENLKQFAQAAIVFERATGTAIDETVKKFNELRNAPLQASLKLNETTNYLTESLYRQIKALEDQGKATEAADLAQKAFANTLQTRGGEITKNIGTIERAWLAVKEAIKGVADAALGVGRTSTGTDRLKQVQDEIATRERRLTNGQAIRGGSIPLSSGDASSERRHLENLRAEEAQLLRVADAEKVKAEAARENLKSVQANESFDKTREQFIDNITKRNRELTKAVQEGVAAHRDQAQILEVINGIRAKYETKGKSTASAENKDLQDRNRIYAELAGVSSTYYAELDTAQKQRAKGSITEAQYVKYVEDLIQKQPFYIAQLKQEAEAVKELRKAREDEANAQDKLLEQRFKSADAVGQQVQKLRDEEQAAGIAAEQNISLAQAIEKVALARLREEQAKLKASGTDEGTLLYLQKEIDYREQIIELLGNKEAREAGVKAAKDAEEAWRRTAESIENSLTDALLRGFESGKGFLKNLIDTTKNLFATLVLRPQIQAVLGIAGSGASGSALASGGSGGGVGGLSSLGSLFGGNSFGQGLGSGAVSIGNFLVGQGFDKVGAGISGFANGAAGFSNLAYGGAGILGGLAGGLFGGQGATGGSLGSTIGLAIGGPIGAALGALGGGLIGSLFGGGTPYNKGGNYQARADGTGSRISDSSLYALLPGLGKAGFQDFTKRGSPAFDTATKTLAESLQTTLSGLLKTFGKEGQDVLVAFRNNGKKSLGQVNIGGVLSNFKTGENDPTKAFTAFTDAGAKALLAALDKADIPAWAKKVLADVGDAPGLQALQQVATTIEQVQTLTAALRALPFPNLTNISEESAIALSKLTGGLDGLNSSVTAYYADFYSEAERSAETTKQLTATLASLGLTLPGSRDAFRALVSAQDLSTESGRKLYAELLKLAPAFASVTTATIAATQAAQDRAAQVAQQDASIASAYREQGAANAAYRESIKGMTDDLYSEAKRIRGLIGSDAGQSFAQAQGRFTTASAQARAGNTDALKSLPGLSQALLETAKQTARSSQELALIRAQTAASLDVTAGTVNKSNGINYTPPAALTSAAESVTTRTTTEDTLAALAKMAEELAALRIASERTAESTRKTSDTLIRVSRDGQALVTTT